jgi:Domain of unknown function (DUF6456)
MPKQQKPLDAPVSLRPLATALAHPGSVAQPSGNGAYLATWTPRRGEAGQRTRLLLAAEVQAALSIGLIRRQFSKALGQELLLLTPAGRSWLKRGLAKAEPFREQHQARRIDHSRQPGVATMVNDAESPLAWLRRRTGDDGRPILDEPRFAAGERLRADFTFAQLQQSTTMNWSGFGSGGDRGSSRGGDLRDDVIAARDRATAALRAVGPELSGVLVDVCFLPGPNPRPEIRRPPLRHPRRSGKVVLLMALQALARHYGLLGTERATAARMAQWGTADFRPRIGAGEKA